MTAQYARNFTHAVKNIDILYNSIDLENNNTVYNYNGNINCSSSNNNNKNSD